MALLNVLPLREDIHPVHRSGWYESLVAVFLLDIRRPMSLFFWKRFRVCYALILMFVVNVWCGHGVLAGHRRPSAVEVRLYTSTPFFHPH